MNERKPESTDTPPPLGTWPRMYAALLTLLGVYIAVFWWVTEAWK